MFIVLEGIDGAGTTTQRGRLANALRARGKSVHETREPSDLPAGKLIRAALRGEEPLNQKTIALLFAADRLDHLVREIEPALARGEVVLCDRYLGSSLVYQTQFCEPAWVCEINAAARPADLTLVVEVDPAEALARRTIRGAAPELFEEARLQERIARAYHKLPTLLPEHRVHLIDGSGPPAEVEARLLQVILEAYNA